MMAALCVIFLFFSQVHGQLGESIIQAEALVTAQIGDTVTLPCTPSDDDTIIASWYKQPFGRKPQLLAILLNYKSEAAFVKELKDSKRLSAMKSEGTFNLTVSQIELSDSATYYCAITIFKEVYFGNGTTLMVLGSESQSRTVVLQQPESESVQPGDPVTLQCTVLTQTCAGEHSVYWFRQGSGESHPGIIYSYGNRSGECQRSSGPASPTLSCVYNLLKRNLNLSDAGTYYCAVATCGEILFGNGTNLDVKGNKVLPLYCLAGALTLSVIINIVLALDRRKRTQNGKGSASNNPVLREDFLSHKQHQDDAMNYAALTFTSRKPKTRRNKREAERETVYSDMRYKDHM